MFGNTYSIKEISSSPLVSCDLETTGLSRRDEIVSAAVSWIDKSNNISSVAFFLDRCSEEDVSVDDERFKEILSATLFNVPSVGNANPYKGIVLFHNLLFDLKFILIRYRDLLSEGRKLVDVPFTRFPFISRDICKVADTASMSRLIKSTKFLSHVDPEKMKCHSLKFLAKEFLTEYRDG